MGKLDTITDITGSMTPLQLNSANIENIVNELNRNTDQLDAISNSLNIIGRGTISGTWSGTGGINAGLTLQTNHGFSQAPIFVASFTRSDIPNIHYPVPQWFYDNNGALTGRGYAWTDTLNINFNFAQTNSGPPVQIVFSWYIIQQPALVPTGQ